MSIYEEFIGTVAANGLTNPYGLAAVAATGKAESGYSPGNVYRQWSDPSESGAPGMAGGIMSWRAERLDRMRQFAASIGDDPNRPSPQTQARFFMTEDPALIGTLQNASSVAEAQNAMNDAWRFAGYNRPGGEAARRHALAREYAGQFGAGSVPEAAPYERDINMGEPQTMAYPNAPVGGLGGLGGFIDQPGVNDVLQSVFSSMISSPRSNWLQDTGVHLDAIRQQREKREETAADREALGGALQMAGLSPEQAQAFSRNPAAAQLALEAQAQRKTEGERNRTLEYLRTNNPEIAQMVDGGLPVSDAYRYMLQQREDEKRGVRRSLQPVYGTNAAGDTVLGQIGDDGVFYETQMPEGFNVSTGVDKIDAGTHFVLQDKRSGEIVGTLPKDIAGVEAEKVRGQTEGERQATASGDMRTAQNALDLIQDLRTDPNREWGTGASAWGNLIPASPGYDYQQKVNQAKSGAFLSAIEQLRGMGALSNAEGQTATAAITRMNTATSEGAFLEALDDYEKIVRQGYEIAASRADNANTTPPAGGSPAASADDPLGLR